MKKKIWERERENKREGIKERESFEKKNMGEGEGE